MISQPQKEHEWLQQLVGEWTFEADCMAGPDQPSSKMTGSDSVRSLGGMWTIGEGQGEMPDGGIGKTIMTLGYDPQKKKYIGTFIGSMMTHLWIYEGTLDPTGKVLTLDTEGPDFSGGSGMVKYQDAIEFIDDDHRTLSSSLLGEDGKWHKFMTSHYRRTK